jgi:hypothetical protein
MSRLFFTSQFNVHKETFPKTMYCVTHHWCSSPEQILKRFHYRKMQLGKINKRWKFKNSKILCIWVTVLVGIVWWRKNNSLEISCISPTKVYQTCGEPAISLHSYTVPLVLWSTYLLPVMRDPGSIPRGVLKWNRDSPVSIVLLQTP